jgi:hypothetical protein
VTVEKTREGPPEGPVFFQPAGPRRIFQVSFRVWDVEFGIAATAGLTLDINLFFMAVSEFICYFIEKVLYE